MLNFEQYVGQMQKILGTPGMKLDVSKPFEKMTEFLQFLVGVARW